MTRVILDTNVFVSAVLGHQVRPILVAWYNERFTLLISPVILSEYLQVLSRPKFALPAEVLESITAYLFRKAEFVQPLEKFQVIQKDPSDNIFLEAAVAGQADWIISGDKQHLLALKEFRQIPIVSPRQFIDWLGKI
ncbi:MAG: putative toxin-antitoxin system toxin component, PIN family [Chloroflexota bacterium]